MEEEDEGGKRSNGGGTHEGHSFSPLLSSLLFSSLLFSLLFSSLLFSSLLFSSLLFSSFLFSFPFLSFPFLSFYLSPTHIQKVRNSLPPFFSSGRNGMDTHFSLSLSFSFKLKKELNCKLGTFRINGQINLTFFSPCTVPDDGENIRPFAATGKVN